MSDNNNSNKRIAQNTAFLYIRMLLIMFVQFFTIRITLRYLGIEDYGIYNVVCGVTNVFTFLTHTMTSASQRFLAFDLGIGDISKLKQTFDTLIFLFTLCGIASILILGIIGTWFIQAYLVIPEERLSAALFAFYFTLFTLFVSIFVLPFNSLIIAHEDMKIFAYVSAIDAVFKLATVYCLAIFPVDKLKLYAALIFVSCLLSAIICIVYCYRKYREVTVKVDINWRLSKKIVPFMSWNLLGGLSWMLCTQGLSILINIFFGPVANAAKAISDKVNSSINGFANNFMMAVQPQIVKNYAKKDFEAMHKVFFLASNMSFFLMMLLVFPISANVDGILSIWLEKHDNLTTVMMQTVLLFSLVSALEAPINQAIKATGNIRSYQIHIGLITFMVIPIAYVFFKIGLPAWYGYISLILVYGFSHITRLYYLKKQVGITYRQYFNEVLRKCLTCLFLNGATILFLKWIGIFNTINPLPMCIVCFCITAGIVYALGLNYSEKKKIKIIVLNIKNKA